MTKLEKHIISAINNKESNELVTYKNGAFFIEEKGIQQNFALIKYDHLFIRIDHNCKGICKKIFKNFDQINYKVCLGNDLISKMIIKDLNDGDLSQILTDTFFLYDLYIIKTFRKYNIDFKDLIYNFVNLFSFEKEFEKIIKAKRFWKNIIYHRQKEDFMGNVLIDATDFEKEELDGDSWVFEYDINKRNNLLDDLLNDD